MAESESISASQLKLVLEIARMLAVTTDLDPLLIYIAEAATRLLGCERASIFLHDKNTNELWTKVALQSAEIRIPCGAGIAGEAFRMNATLHIPDPYKDPRFNPEPDRRTGFTTRNLLTVPVVGIDHEPVGVIQAVNKCSGGFSESDPAIMQLLADHAGVALQRYWLQQAAVESAGLIREMDLAKDVQQALIPKNPPEIPGLDCVGWTRAASVAGGDSYDLWKLADGRLGVFVGDASGHGMAPALVVSQVRTLIRALAEIETDPVRLMVRVNARMAEDLRSGQFITAFLGFLSSDGMLEWTSAGHGPILVRLKSNGAVTELDPASFPIGILPDWAGDATVPLKIEPGGSLIVMTDGIFESFSPSGELFDTPRVLELLDQNVNRTPAETVDAIRKAVVEWQGREEPMDDQTMVIVRLT